MATNESTLNSLIKLNKLLKLINKRKDDKDFPKDIREFIYKYWATSYSDNRHLNMLKGDIYSLSMHIAKQGEQVNKKRRGKL